MATRTVLVDDIDGSEATETVSFGLDGARYEVDLNNENAKEFRETMGFYIDKARTVGGSKAAPKKAASNKKKATTRSQKSRSDSAAIREWAVASGIEVPARGRIPASVRRAYEEAA